MALELAPVGQDLGRGNGKVQGQLCGQMTVRQAPDPVRAEECAACDATYAISAC